jgi:hypothetical protein
MMLEIITALSDDRILKLPAVAACSAPLPA